MAISKRPPLELDDLTNNLKQSSGKGVDAFFSAPPTLQEEKSRLFKKNRIKRITNMEPRTRYYQYSQYHRYQGYPLSE
jgi:hypothetical protein